MTKQAPDPFLTDLTGTTVRMTGYRVGRDEQVTDEWVVRESFPDEKSSGMHHSLIRVKDGICRIASYRPLRFDRGWYDFDDIWHHYGVGWRRFREDVTMEVVS